MAAGSVPVGQLYKHTIKPHGANLIPAVSSETRLTLAVLLQKEIGSYLRCEVPFVCFRA